MEEFEGKTFQFVGPADYTYKEVAEFVQDVILTRKPLIDVPINVASTAGKITEQFISPFFSQDLLAQMQENVVEKKNTDLLTLNDLQIEPSSMDRVAFDYLHRFRRGGHFTLAKGYH